MTWWKGELVGTDQFDNRYYKEKNGDRRWVIYAAAPEASQVPPEWHAWLHRTIDEPPLGPRAALPWQREHEPNRTGTAEAYRPSGSLVQEAQRPPATGDYEAWVPD